MNKYTRIRRRYLGICTRCLGSGFVATKHGPLHCPLCAGTGNVEKYLVEIVNEDEGEVTR